MKREVDRNPSLAAIDAAFERKRIEQLIAARQKSVPVSKLPLVFFVMRGTHDPNSPLFLMAGKEELLHQILYIWAWPEVLVNSARLWKPQLLIETLIAEMLEANCGVEEAKLRKGLVLKPDGTVVSWDLRDCRLRALPELFGALDTTGDLGLGDNQLSSLPDSFGSITVGGTLGLQYNQLSSLPASFGSITVGRHLRLNHNQLSSFPASFGNITFSLNMWLDGAADCNQLTELPDSFQDLDLQRCNLGYDLWEKVLETHWYKQRRGHSRIILTLVNPTE